MDLKYRVYSVSSESQDAPASHLQELAGGWESDINCPYPQELTVQFYVPVQTKNMKIVFHQYKIPKLIEIFVRCGRHQKYRKLGFVQPNDNSQTNYLQKQIKTIFFQFPCTFVKLVFHPNYKNELNLFDQIALSQLTFDGRCLPASQLANFSSNVLEELDTSEDEDTSLSIPEADSSMPSALEKPKKSQPFESVLYPEVFEMLARAKNEALEREDFQRASYIKNTVENFKQVEMQILRLEEQKRQALADEEYDKCHRLKIEINNKKEVASFQINEFNEKFNEPHPLAFSKFSQQGHNNRSNYITHRSNRIETEEAIRSPQPNRKSEEQVQVNVNYNEHQEMVVPALANANKGVKRNITEEYYSEQKANDSLIGLKSPSTVRKEEEAGGEESIDMRVSDIQQVLCQYNQLEPLDFKTMKRYEPYFDYIPSEFWRMVLSIKYHKNWQLKSIALDEALALEVNSGTHVLALLELVAITLLDNFPIVIKKSLKVLEKLTSLADKQFHYSNSLPRYCVNSVLETLIHLMNDTKEQFRKGAQEVFKNLPEFGIIHLEQTIKILIQSAGANKFNKNKRKSNPRLQLAKLSLLEHFIITYKDTDTCFNEIIKWAIECLGDPNSQVKTNSNKLLLMVAARDRETYSRVRQEIHKSDPAACEVFDSQFDALMESYLSESRQEEEDRSMADDIYKKETVKNKKKKPQKKEEFNQINDSSINSPIRMKDSDDVELAYSQESILPDASPSQGWFASPNQKDPHDIKVMEDFEEDLEGLCGYCFQRYEEDQRLHLIESCPVVVRCKFCRGMIYLRELTDHLLDQCKRKHKQCPKCLLAFELDEINDHKAQGVCRRSRGDMERCPFCEEDVEADDIAWVEHSEKCSQIVKHPQIELSMQSDEV